MDYGEILKKELSRSDMAAEDAYESSGSGAGVVPVPCGGSGDMLDDCEFLLDHVPSEGDIKLALEELATGSAGGVRLVPVRSYLQVRLRVTAQRIDELIGDNGWIQSWIGYIRALQDVKMVEEFSGGNMEEGRFKWLLWSVLGERVELSSGRMSGGDMGGESAGGGCGTGC